MATKQIPLYGEIGSEYNSATSVDSSDPPYAQFYLNGYFENMSYPEESMQKLPYNIGKVAFCKRPGTVGCSQFIGTTALSASCPIGYKIKGTVTSLDKTKLLFVLNNGTTVQLNVYDASADTIVPKTFPAGWNASLENSFTILDGISYGTNVYYAVTDFTKGGLIAADGTITEITDVDFTSLTKSTNFVGLDGYLFVGTTDNRIYNSDLNTASSWAATSFISCNDTPGQLLWLAKIRNYLIAFKQYSIEFFEDTGNPAPGSPLTSAKSLNRKIGLASRGSVQEVADGIIFLGISPGGKIQVYKLDKETLSLKPISNQFIDQVLGSFAGVFAQYSIDPICGTGANSGQSQVVNYRGKEFYLLYVREGKLSAVDRTWVYDNQLDTWVRWATCSAGADTLDNNFTPTQAQMLNINGKLVNILAQNNFVSGSAPAFFVIIASSSLTFSDTITAAGSYLDYPLEWVSPIYDFGSRKRKFMDSLEVIFETYNQAGSGTSDQLVLYYRDNDYNSTSPNKLITRTINFNSNASPTPRAIFRRLGSFRRRNFGIKHLGSANSYSFKLWGIEVSYNDGETEQGQPNQ